jgi:hypothetical protein
MCLYLLACVVVQVEARLRQLEGRSLASDSAKKGKQQPAAYNAAAEQAGGGGLLAGSGAKAYNAAADVVPVSFWLSRMDSAHCL